MKNTELMSRQQIVARAKAIVQAALDERDKAIDEAQGMLRVISAVMVKNGGEIVLTQDEIDNAPRSLAFETDENGARRICAFEMREKEGAVQEQPLLPAPPERLLLPATTGETAAISREASNGAKIELM